MKIQIVSDLHLEFTNHPVNIFSEKDVVGDVLILAGDTETSPTKLLNFVRTINKVPVLIVLGNHEYYGNQLETRQIYTRLLNNPAENMFVLQESSVSIGEYLFVGSTLWSALTTADKEVPRLMNDYRQIYTGARLIRLSDIAERHEIEKSHIEETLSQNPDKVKIVVTHHAPSLQSIPKHFTGNVLNVAYATNLEDIILKHKPALWVHGHTHNSMDYNIGGTRVICNPHGYYQYETNPAFNRGLCVEV